MRLIFIIYLTLYHRYAYKQIILKDIISIFILICA